MSRQPRRREAPRVASHPGRAAVDRLDEGRREHERQVADAGDGAVVRPRRPCARVGRRRSARATRRARRRSAGVRARARRPTAGPRTGRASRPRSRSSRGPPSGGRRRTAGRARSRPRARRSPTLVLATSVIVALGREPAAGRRALRQPGSRAAAPRARSGRRRRRRPRSTAAAGRSRRQPRPRAGPRPDGVHATIDRRPAPGSPQGARDRAADQSEPEHRDPHAADYRRRRWDPCGHCVGPWSRAGAVTIAPLCPGTCTPRAAAHRVSCTACRPATAKRDPRAPRRRPPAPHGIARRRAGARARHGGRRRGGDRRRGQVDGARAARRRPDGLPPAGWHRGRGDACHQGPLARLPRRDADGRQRRRDDPRVDPGRRRRLPDQGPGRRRRRQRGPPRQRRRDAAPPLRDHGHRPARGRGPRPNRSTGARSSR